MHTNIRKVSEDYGMKLRRLKSKKNIKLPIMEENEKREENERKIKKTRENMTNKV